MEVREHDSNCSMIQISGCDRCDCGVIPEDMVKQRKILLVVSSWDGGRAFLREDDGSPLAREKKQSLNDIGQVFFNPRKFGEVVELKEKLKDVLEIVL